MKEADLDLLKRFTQARDADAFSQIVERYQDSVYSTCVRVLDDPAGAEDASQECFLRLLQKADTVRSSLAGWLHRCATNMSIDEMRGRALRKRTEEVNAKMNAASRNDPTWHELAPHVDKALDELPEHLRIAIVEHLLQRRTQAEIAEQLGVSAMTVSRRVESGIEELRKNFKKAGLIVSAALLASLISENAVQAAPAALTAALSKMSVLAATKSGGAVSSAGWVGVGTAPKAAAAGAKTKLLIGALAAVAVGVGALHLATKGNGQPPAQPQPAAVADKPEEQPAAPQLDPLLAAIPADAVVFWWAPNLRQLADRAAALMPLYRTVLDDVVANKLPKLGVTNDVLDGPAAVVMMSLGQPPLDPRMVGLFSVKDMDAVIATMESGPDANGMYSRLLLRPSTEEEPAIYEVNMMPYKGFAAFSDKKRNLQALADADEKAYEPSAEALRLIDDAQAFLHIDAATVRQMIGLDTAPQGVVVAFWALPVREANSVDLSFTVDDAGVNLRAAVAVKDDSKVVEYLVPARGLDKLEPRLPLLPNYAAAAWVKGDKKVAARLISNLMHGVERAMLKQAAGRSEAVNVLTKAFGLIMRARSDVGGPGFGVALQMGGFVSGLGVFDLAKPQEFRARVQQQLEAAREFEYQANAETVSSDDGLITAQVDLVSHVRRIRVPMAIIGDKLVLASSRGNITKALHTLQGRDDVPVLAEQPPAKGVLAKIGLGHNAIIVLDLIPLFEKFLGANRRLREFAPAPVAIGLKAEEGNVLRIKAYLPKKILVLPMMGLSGPSARSNRPPIERNIERN